MSGPASKVVGEGVAGWEEVRSLVANAVADGTTRPRRGLHRRTLADQRRDLEVDGQLKAAGIEPGAPRLYPTALGEKGGGR